MKKEGDDFQRKYLALLPKFYIAEMLNDRLLEAVSFLSRELFKPSEAAMDNKQTTETTAVSNSVNGEQVEAAVADEFYFTAYEGIVGSHHEIVDKGRGSIPKPLPKDLRLLTFCILLLKNGFTVTGESACASPKNFNAETGRNLAREKAIDKVWQLEGYLLKEKLHNDSK